VGKNFFTVSAFSKFWISGADVPGQKFQNPENVLTVKKKFPTEVYRKLGWGLTVNFTVKLTVNLAGEKNFLPSARFPEIGNFRAGPWTKKSKIRKTC
jgi:hypothetical protein